MTPAERILAKSLAASPMKSADWSSVQAGLRDRAFFSATVDDARRLAVMREAVAKVAAGDLSESQARLAIREALAQTGYTPPQGKEGGLQDLSSQRRLDLIIQTNVAEARGYVRYLEGTSEGALAAFPCQEFLRVERRKAERTTWRTRWERAGGKFFADRMIALKTDQVWTNLSAFHHPWPPFDFNSGMGLRDVGRREAIRYGVIPADAPPPKPPKPPKFNDGLSAPLPDKKASEFMEDYLQARLGSQVSVQKGVIRFNADIISDMLEGRGKENATFGIGKFNPRMLAKIPDADARKLAEQAGLTISRDWMRDHGRKHENPSGKGKRNMPITSGDWELLPSLWHNPDRVTVTKPGELELMLDTLDGGTLFLGVRLKTGRALTFQKRRRLK